jgi:hypothetical protein
MRLAGLLAGTRGERRRSSKRRNANRQARMASRLPLFLMIAALVGATFLIEQRNRVRIAAPDAPGSFVGVTHR